MPYIKIQPEKPKVIKKYVDTLNPKSIQKPTRVYFPEVLRQNIRLIEDLPVTTYLAHKATKTKEFLDIAKEERIGIDVASIQELQNALDTGINTEKIEATGPKNKEFLEKCVENNVLISIDSIHELKEIKNTGKPANILIRVANPAEEGVIFSKTKFGILKKELPKAKQILENTDITMRGFHFHGDGMSVSMKGKIISYFLKQIEKHFPKATKINIGGTFTEKLFKKNLSWSKLIQNITKDIKNQEVQTWGQAPYGIKKGSKNEVVGGDQALLPGKDKTLREQIQDLLLAETVPNTTVTEILEDTDIELLVEPGHALLYNTGIAIFPVEYTKNIIGGNLTVLNGNTFMVSKNMREPYADPTLISKSTLNKEYHTFLGGLLCRDDDVFMTRKVKFKKNPCPGDLIVFYNKGSYEAYEEGTPQSQPTADRITA